MLDCKNCSCFELLANQGAKEAQRNALLDYTWSLAEMTEKSYNPAADPLLTALNCGGGDFEYKLVQCHRYQNHI